MKLSCLVVFGLMLSFSSPTPAFAQHDLGSGYPFDIPGTRVTALSHNPVPRFPIEGLDTESSTLVNAAIELSHGFWTYEAERVMREVIARNPKHPLTYALAAYIETIFGSGDMERGEAYFRAAKLALPSASLSKHEQLWFEAIASLYDQSKPESLRNFLHIEGLEKIVNAYPDDLEARAYLVYHYWGVMISSETLQPNEHAALVARADSLIESVLAQSPTHPIHHYKIHLWNTNRDEFRALDSARASGPAQPHIAHLWHMPAHILWNTDDAYYALRHIEAAHRVDHKQMLERGLMPTQVHNYYHNFRDFGLSIKSNSGQVDDALSQGLAMLRFGRLAHPSSRGAMSTLARKLLVVLEEYQLWDRFLELNDLGYFANLSTGMPTEDILSQAVLLRMKVRATPLDTEKNLHKLEALADRAQMDGLENKDLIGSLFDDSRLWYEISLRANSGAVPQYFLEKLATTCHIYPLTPCGQVLVAAQKLGMTTFARSFYNENRSAYLNGNLSEALNVLAYFELAGLADDRGAFEERIINQLTPPFSLAGFSGFLVTQENPQLVSGLMQKAQARFASFLEKIPEEFNYLKSMDLNALGPAQPQYPRFANYSGSNVEASDAFASPLKGYKLFVFAVGPSCSACNQQLLGLAQNREKLSKLGIEPIAVTQTGEIVEGLRTVPDVEGAIHRELGIWDEFDDRALHGLILIDRERQMLWNSYSDHPVTDIAFIMEEFERLTRLQK